MTARAALPSFARVVRSLSDGTHPYRALLPGADQSPALARIFTALEVRSRVLDSARVLIREERGFAWVDDEVPCIVLSSRYYRDGHERDLYLDLLHELTHLRQLDEGRNIWDESLPYVERPTEVEGYAVAVEEGRRLGMSEQEILAHLSNPWMSPEDVQRLIHNVEALLGRS